MVARSRLLSQPPFILNADAEWRMLMLMSAVETGQMSAVETRHLSLFPIYRYPPQRPPTRFGPQTWTPPPEGLIRCTGAVILSLGHVGRLCRLRLAHLGPSWSHVGSLLAPTWPSWRSLGPSWGHLGSNLAVLARPWLSLGQPEAPFGPLKPTKTKGK